MLLHIDINNLVAISHTGPLKLIEISFSLLPGSCAPHGITVVDGDVLALLDVHGGPNHHTEVAVKVFACIVDT